MADTSGLLAALSQLADAPPAPRGPRCTVGTILDTLDTDTALKVRDVLDSPSVSSTQIADALTGSGHPVQSPAVARHRRRGGSNGCRCPR
ncbi:hypothetical protein OHS33_38745 (plasmid) [Streptomyces sp. NBC_00536]|uniref:hypothetical protein n=1 Tax=Streptomyces sp. NBC_00536 TaxID=2975769 RepID=UPI002E804BEE|nr:hypothetical protein [Streptomyces sp. NBC_00536]WUC84442.1 hypothetical protein OHS33_38745 [Streptomyces sp. NBC_00536]